MLLLFNGGMRKRRPLLFVHLFAILFIILLAQFVFRPAIIAHAKAITYDNWAGYEASDARRTYVGTQVSFTVPSIPRKSGANVGIWAGVGGDENKVSPAVLVQTGIASYWDFSVDHQVNYSWWEVEGRNSDGSKTISTGNQRMDLKINVGDQIQAYVGSNAYSDGYDDFVVTNLTTGQVASHYIYNPEFFSDGATAECIVEAPGWTRTPLPLANFGTLTLTGCEALPNEGNKVGLKPIGSFLTDSITMANHRPGSAKVLATTGKLGADGSSFKVTWHHA